MYRYYSLDNNLARHETVKEAAELDLKTKNAWMGHPRHFIIDNQNKSFEEKMEQLVGLVAESVGMYIRLCMCICISQFRNTGISTFYFQRFLACFCVFCNLRLVI
jgi:hypothetical protein